MAKNTNIKLRNDVIYSIFVRNHGREGTFLEVIKDLDRIKGLGTDIIWFIPIHPIGLKERKGKLGCPYAIKNYREVNPEYGTMKDFELLVQEIHNRGMKCIIDVVYNHTSPDSWLAENHPEFFYKSKDGKLGSKNPDWADVADLDYGNFELRQYLIDTLKMWAGIVDGFRCDVAPMIPLDFWLEAREKVEEIKPGCIWLAETVELNFVKLNRNKKVYMCSDSEVYQAFDICYDYDVNGYRDAYLEGTIPLEHYVEMLNMQEVIYPTNYVKLRFLENHDRRRAKAVYTNEKDLVNWVAFMYFQKGTALIYAGQETENDHTPDLFDMDKVDWDTGKDLSKLFMSLYQIKKKVIVTEGNYHLKALRSQDIVVGCYETENQKLIGIFSLKSEACDVNVDLVDGIYKNLINGENVIVECNKIHTKGDPIIVANEVLAERCELS